MSGNPQELANWVHTQLLAAYGVPKPKDRLDPLSELIQTILSQNTSDRTSSRAYAELRRRFPDWEQVLHVDVEQVAEAIHVGGLAHTKAARIQAILRQLKSELNKLDLGHLADMPTSQARDYLLGLHGVGSKTAACVLLFSLGKPALPVDTHVQRVSVRLGLVSAKSNPNNTQQLLESYLEKAKYYPFHLNMIHHGRVCCTAMKPQCPSCPLKSGCEYFHLQASSSLI